MTINRLRDLARPTLSFQASFVQFMRPRGEQRPQVTDLPIACKAKYDLIQAERLWLTIENLGRGQIQACVDDRARGDYLSVLAPNGPGLQEKLAEMIQRFDLDEYRAWAKQQDDAGRPQA